MIIHAYSPCHKNRRSCLRHYVSLKEISCSLLFFGTRSGHQQQIERHYRSHDSREPYSRTSVCRARQGHCYQPGFDHLRLVLCLLCAHHQAGPCKTRNKSQPQKKIADKNAFFFCAFNQFCMNVFCSSFTFFS